MSLLRPLAVITLLASATPHAAAQANCPHGRADETSVSMNVGYPFRMSRIREAVNAALRARGYAVVDTLTGNGRWVTAPRFTWLPGTENDAWHGSEHPGVQVRIVAEPMPGDSTRVTIVGGALCAVAEGDRLKTESTLEVFTTMDLMTALNEKLEALAAVPEEDEADGVSITIPQAVGQFRFRQRHDYPNPAAGVQLRYAGPGDWPMDVYVYPGPAPDCTRECATERLNGETANFLGDIPELISRGYYQALEVRADEPLAPGEGDLWYGGRHLALEGREQGRRVASHFYLFAFPGYMVKVRATYPPSGESDALTRRFVADVLPLLVGRAQ